MNCCFHCITETLNGSQMLVRGLNEGLRGSAEYQTRLFNGTCSGNTNKRLSCSTRKHYNPRASTTIICQFNICKITGAVHIPITEHLAQACLLIWSNDSCRLQVNVEICVNRIVPEVVLLQHWIFKLVATLLDILQRLIRRYVKRQQRSRTSIFASWISKA